MLKRILLMLVVAQNAFAADGITTFTGQIVDDSIAIYRDSELAVLRARNVDAVTTLLETYHYESEELLTYFANRNTHQKIIIQSSVSNEILSGASAVTVDWSTKKYTLRKG